VSVQVPKVRDRSGAGIKFTSALLPPYLIDTLIRSCTMPVWQDDDFS
jgi:hypothetical protein